VVLRIGEMIGSDGKFRVISLSSHELANNHALSVSEGLGPAGKWRLAWDARCGVRRATT
jgi:hypothetical protein